MSKKGRRNIRALIVTAVIMGAVLLGRWVSGEQVLGVQVSGEQVSRDRWESEEAPPRTEEVSEEQESEEQVSGDQWESEEAPPWTEEVSEEQESEDQVSDEQIPDLSEEDINRDLVMKEEDIYQNRIGNGSADTCVHIEYGTTYDLENRAVNYQIPIDLENSDVEGKENIYSYDVVDEQQSCITENAPFQVDGDGIVTFIRAMNADERAYVMITRKTAGYPDAVKMIGIFIEKRRIYLDPEHSVFALSKEYDGKSEISNAIFLPREQAFKRNETEGGDAVVGSEDIRIQNIVGNADTEERNVGTYHTAIHISSICLQGEDKENYEVLIPSDQPEGIVEILPREYRIRINDAEREYGTTIYTKRPELNREEACTGFLAEDSDEEFAELEKAVIFTDCSEVTSPMEIYREDLSNLYIVPSVREEVTDSIVGNYRLVIDEELSVGKLIIQPETMNEEKWKRYISMDDSVNWRQDDDALWIKGAYDDNPGKLMLSLQSGLPYNTVTFEDGAENYTVDPGTNEVLFPSNAGEIQEVTIFYRLQQKNEYGDVIAETQEHGLTVKVDSAAPDISILSDTVFENGIYAQGPVVLNVEVKERNLDAENIWLNVKWDNQEQVLRLSSGGNENIKIIKRENPQEDDRKDDQEDDQEDVREDDQETPQQKEYTEEAAVNYQIQFLDDGDYRVVLSSTDRLGNGPSVPEGKSEFHFIIDQTPPKLTVQFEDNSENRPFNEKYYQKGRMAKVTIEERNPDEDGTKLLIKARDLYGNILPGGRYEYTLGQLQKENGIDSDRLYISSVADTDENATDTAEISNNRKLMFDVYFPGDANYEVELICCKDKAAQYTEVKGNASFSFTVDTSAPRGGKLSAAQFGTWISRFLSKITFGYFSNGTVAMTLSGSDGELDEEGEETGVNHISPVKSIQYYKSTGQMTREELDSLPESAWITGSSVTVGNDEQFIIYEKVTNYVNLWSYFSSDGIIVDHTSPEPEITVTNLTQAENGIFNEDVLLRIDVRDSLSEGTYSGLKRVWYTVAASGYVPELETIYLMDDSALTAQGSETFSRVITIPAGEEPGYNSNDIQVQVYAEDFSGNQGQSGITQLKIDTAPPEVYVTWDDSKPMNGKYYKETRTAVVTVKERNFDPERVKFFIGPNGTAGKTEKAVSLSAAAYSEWSSSPDQGSSDEALNICRLSFPEDGDYTFTLECTDLAGNKAEYDRIDAFTIDKTAPEITVVYDNNSVSRDNYYKEPRTAVITVKEHNFDSEAVRSVITAALEGQRLEAPVISDFTNDGDVHTASVYFGTDGDYTLDFGCADLAGNMADDYGTDAFTVDLTPPKVEIFDIVDRSANNDVVSPGIRYTDINSDSRGVSITLESANHGAVQVERAVTGIKNGRELKYNDFPREAGMDDLYCLTARITDLAGNKTEKSVTFSVNRYGSVYVLDDDTKKWLGTADREQENNDQKDTYINSPYAYINHERSIGVYEYNVDEVEEYRVITNLDGDLKILEEKSDFDMTKSENKEGWKEYYYRIYADNFKKEGNYSVTIWSRDKANNTMNNETSKITEGELPLRFTVDKTPPTAVVSGVEDGKRYHTASRSIAIDVKDNLALAQVKLTIGDAAYVYNAEELYKMNGVIRTELSASDDWQMIRVTAKDAADNILGQNQAGDGGTPLQMKVLITPDIAVLHDMENDSSRVPVIAVILLVILTVSVTAVLAYSVTSSRRE